MELEEIYIISSYSMHHAKAVLNQFTQEFSEFIDKRYPNEVVLKNGITIKTAPYEDKMVFTGKRNYNVFYANDFLEYCYKYYCLDLKRENQQLKNDNAVMKAGLIQIRDEQLDLYKSVIDEIDIYLEHYLIGNMRFKDSQKEFEKLHKMIDKTKENLLKI